MDWQQIVSLTVVAVTAALFLRGRFRRRRFDFAKDTPCGCAGRGDKPPTVTYRSRRGERTQVMIKN